MNVEIDSKVEGKASNETELPRYETPRIQAMRERLEKRNEPAEAPGGYLRGSATLNGMSDLSQGSGTAGCLPGRGRAPRCPTRSLRLPS